MDQITAVEQQLLELGIPASVPADQLRRLAKDILWQALEVDSAQALTEPVASLQAAFELPYNADDCERVAANIWGMAHDT